MDNCKQNLSHFVVSFMVLSLILAAGPYLTLKTVPALGILLAMIFTETLPAE